MSDVPDYAIWNCQVGDLSLPKSDLPPEPLDGPMREAVERAFREATGRDAQFTFSGWGGPPLSPAREAVVRDELPDERAEEDWLVEQFARAMRFELADNRHKGAWHLGERDDSDEHRREQARELLYHAVKLIAAASRGDRTAVHEYAADVGNCAAFIADNADALGPELEHDGPIDYAVDGWKEVAQEWKKLAASWAEQAAAALDGPPRRMEVALPAEQDAYAPDPGNCDWCRGDPDLCDGTECQK